MCSACAVLVPIDVSLCVHDKEDSNRGLKGHSFKILDDFLSTLDNSSSTSMGLEAKSAILDDSIFQRNLTTTHAT
jgi:hypothetical protein